MSRDSVSWLLSSLKVELIRANLSERRFNHVDLRLFGPNATIGILGKICFDFSNNLQHKSISRNEMTSILDWIGYRADKTSLKTFFGQKASTILAAWEALLSTILSREHSAALDVILFIHSSLKDQAPLVTGKWGHGLSNYLRSAPDRAAALINAYPWDQHELDKALRDALSFRFCPPRSWPCVGKYWIFDPDLVQPLVGAGASLKNEDRRFSVDHLVCNFGRPQYQAADVDLLKSLLEAGAVVDEPPDLSRDWAEMSSPIHATDYLLLDGGNSTHNHHLWSLISSYSDRQQTTVTVPGIFEAAQGGHEQLRDYLSARSKPHNSDVRSRILEISLSEASGRGHANVVQSLVQFGIDPNVPTLPRKSTNRRLGIWHPIIRAANNGNVDTLRILVTASTNDIASRWYPYEVEELDILAWRDMERSQLHQTLRLLSTLNLATATRNEILLHALSPHNFGRDYDDIDFGLVNQLLDLGLAALDLRAYADEGTHPLVRAMRKGCGSRALNYLVELDIGVISGLFDTTTVLLFDSARSCHELNTMMKFLSEKVEGFKAYVQENSSSFLSKSLSCSCDVSSYAEHMAQGNDCELMVLVKWLLGLGATLNIYGLATLTKHATESFMLALIDTVPDIKAVGRSSALEQTISLGQLNLAAALIEKGGILINFTRIRGSFHMIPETILQRACAEGVPLWFIKFLVKKGADVNAPPAYYDGLTALQYAARAGSMNVVGLLLDCGADINAISGFHWTQPVYSMRAIDVAALHARLDMVHFLIAAGARSGHLGLTGFDGAITLATESRRFAIAALLQKYADSHRGDRLEAERRWLQANPDARMYKGRIEPQGAFNKREDEDSEADYTG